MRRFVFAFSLLLVLILLGTSLVYAGSARKAASDLAVGAQLYDKWYAVLGISAPAGDMPIWNRQSTNTRSGADTWRCSECHGWDYKGVSGAYASGSHKTGFPSLLNILPNLSQEEIIAHLKGGKDPAHDFSAYLDEASMQKVALFLKDGLIDDGDYIDSASLKVIGGNVEHGAALYASTCAACHGADGRKIIFHSEGLDESLAAVASRDPFRFLHRTRFGVAGTEMPIGYDLGWSAVDGRDVLAYTQTLPGVGQAATSQPASEGSEPAPQTIGGPSDNPLLGIFTAVLAAFGMIGISILLLAVFVFIGVLIVFALRRRR